MDVIELPRTDKQFRQFIDSQIDIIGLTTAVDDAQNAYEQARTQRFDLKRQLAEHDAKRPDGYSYEWTKVRYKIVNALLICIEEIEQSRNAFDKARSALWNARCNVIAQLRTP